LENSSAASALEVRPGVPDVIVYQMVGADRECVDDLLVIEDVCHAFECDNRGAYFPFAGRHD
jgi:hypothetical protein